MPASPGYYAFTPEYSPCASPVTDTPNSLFDSPKYISPLDLSISSRVSTPSPLDLRINAIDLSVSPSRSPSSSSFTESSPTSTSSSSRVGSSSTYSSSSPVRIPPKINMNISARYRQLSPPRTPPLILRKRNLYNECPLSYAHHSPVSSTNLSSPQYESYRRMSSNYSLNCRPTTLDYSCVSPRRRRLSLVYGKSSPELSPTPTETTVGDSSPGSYSSLLYSPLSPQYTSTSSEYSPSSPKYISDVRYKNRSSPKYIPTNSNYYYSWQYSPQYSPTLQKHFRPASLSTYYPLSPQYTPTSPPRYYSSVLRRKNTQDVPCVCCSPPLPKY